MAVERNLILARFGEHICALQTLVNANVERQVILKDSIAKSRVLLKSGPSVDRSEYSVKISKLARELQWLSSLVQWKNLKLQTIALLIGGSRRLWEEHSVLKIERDQLAVKYKLMLAFGTEISELMRTTGSNVGSLKEVRAHAVETDRGLKNAQGTIAKSSFCKRL